MGRITAKKALATWEAVLESLRGTLDAAAIDLWLRPLQASYDQEREELILVGLDQYSVTYVADTYLPQVQVALSKTVLADTKIKIRFGQNTKDEKEAGPSTQGSIVPISSAVIKPHPPRQIYLYPTKLCRSTFFRPVPRKDLRPASESFDHPPVETKWASLIWHGPDCGIREEDVLIFVIHKWVRQNFPDRLHCTYSEILDALHYKRDKKGSHDSNNFTSIKESLERIAKVSFKLVNKKKGKDTVGAICGLMTMEWDDTIQKLTIIIDRRFGANIADGYVSGIEDRFSLKKDVSKALHRFLSSHGMEGHYNILDVAQAINMDMNLAYDSILRSIQLGVKELKGNGFIETRSGIKKGVLHWWRSGQVLAGPKLVERVKMLKG